MIEIKKIAVNVDGKEYSAKWSTWALEQFWDEMLEHERKEDKSNETTYSMGYMRIARKVTRGMMVRAGLTNDQYDELDGDITSEMSKKILDWFMSSVSSASELIPTDPKKEAKNGTGAGEKVSTNP